MKSFAQWLKEQDETSGFEIGMYANNRLEYPKLDIKKKNHYNKKKKES